MNRNSPFLSSNIQTPAALACQMLCQHLKCQRQFFLSKKQDDVPVELVLFLFLFSSLAAFRAAFAALSLSVFDMANETLLQKQETSLVFLNEMVSQKYFITIQY